MSKVVAIMSMSLDGYVADLNDGAGWPRPNSTVHFVTDGIESAVNQAKAAAAGKSVGTPAVLGNPKVISGVGVTHLRYPVRKA
jgi:dihydrofolate reductase